MTDDPLTTDPRDGRARSSACSTPSPSTSRARASTTPTTAPSAATRELREVGRATAPTSTTPRRPRSKEKKADEQGRRRQAVVVGRSPRQRGLAQAPSRGGSSRRKRSTCARASRASETRRPRAAVAAASSRAVGLEDPRRRRARGGDRRRTARAAPGAPMSVRDRLRRVARRSTASGRSPTGESSARASSPRGSSAGAARGVRSFSRGLQAFCARARERERLLAVDVVVPRLQPQRVAAVLEAAVDPRDDAAAGVVDRRPSRRSASGSSSKSTSITWLIVDAEVAA